MALMYETLWEAIPAATQGAVNSSMAIDQVSRAWSMGGGEAVKTLAESYGVQFTYATQEMQSYGLAHWYTINSLPPVGGPAGETFMYPAVLESSINTTTNEVVLETVKQTSTQAGKTFLKGALKTATEALPIVGAIVTGVELGWESYKEHPDFWTDFSESMFNTSDPTVPVEVLARAHSGGYTTAVKEETMCKILQELAEHGCFDYEDFTSTIEHTGNQDLNWTSAPAIGKASEIGKAYAASNYPGYTVVQVSNDMIRGNLIEGYTTIATNLPDYGGVTTENDYQGNPVYCVTIEAISIYTSYNIVTGESVYAPSTPGYYSIYSGKFSSTSPDIYVVGGLNCEIEYIVADNELFPNDHSGAALSIPPSASITDIATAIRDQYPDWYNDSYTITSYNPETGEIDEERYYPVTIPWWDPVNNPDKDPDFTPSAARDGDVLPESDPNAKQQQKTITNNNNQYDTPGTAPTPEPSPSDPGAGAGGTSDRLWSVYNPSMAELNALGAYLWSSNIIDILQKFLQNPMDAIISLHKIYCEPEVQGRQSIALGYLDSGVSANVVVNQFVSIDCGTVEIDEYFNDVRDYVEPYTTIEAYLPFVGIVRWKTADIVGGKVKIVYTIDVYSGACLCKVFVTKLGVQIQLYTYSGNCSMQIPLTGSDRTRLLSGAVSGFTTGAVAGGAVGAIAGAVAGAWTGGTSIDRTCNFSSNAGCMGIKKPYILVTRKYSYDAGYYNTFYGYPSNNTLTLSACHGYTRVKSVHIESIPIATSDEKQMIETLLKQGVIIR